MKSEAYLEQLQSLLPSGSAWSRDNEAVITDILRIIAFELVNSETRINNLIVEADARTTFEMLEDWERNAGLPDNCSQITITLQERVQALVQKITNTGGQSIVFFKEIANRLGYPNIEIYEYLPFIAGLNQCGDLLNGGHDVRFYWKVAIPDARLTYFRTGQSRAGDTLLTIAKALDLECIFNRLKPAHTNLIFSYEGV